MHFNLCGIQVGALGDSRQKLLSGVADLLVEILLMFRANQYPESKIAI